MNDRQIAAYLDKRVTAVRNHKAQIMNKLNLDSLPVSQRRAGLSGLIQGCGIKEAFQ